MSNLFTNITPQAYDLRRNARTDPALISEEAKRRINERKEWARIQREESEKRMLKLNAQIQREKRAREEALEKMKREADLVTDMLQQMYQSNPEFAARREAALKVWIVLYKICAYDPNQGGTYSVKKNANVPEEHLVVANRKRLIPKHFFVVVFVQAVRCV